MTARQYRAVIESPGKPKTLEVIAAGTREHCAGALAAWRSFAKGGTEATGTPLIVVEVTE